MGWGAIGARAILLAIAGVLALLVIRGQREPSEGREHTGAPRPPRAGTMTAATAPRGSISWPHRRSVCRLP